MNRILATFILAILFVTSSTAQTSGGNSPYSRYGWGILSEDAQGFNKAMAGTGIGFRKLDALNHQNPASYSALDSITLLFDAGISLQNGHWSENGKSTNALNSTLDYLQAGFRMTKNLGFCIGIQPISLVSYDFFTTQKIDDIDGFGEYTSSSSYRGEGGVNKAWIGLGWEPIKNFSIGANVGYIWGNYKHQSSITYSNTAIHSLARMYTANINTYSLDLGFQYTQEISKKDDITIGATFGLGHDIKSSSTFINQKMNTSASLGGDTLKVGNAFSLPKSFGVGVTYHHNKQITLAADYTCQLWKNCKFPVMSSNTQDGYAYTVGTNSFRNRHKIAIGGEYIPDPNGLKVRHHVCYRAGVSYATSYVDINGGSGPKSLIVSAGMGLPIVNMYNNRSVLNVALQWEHLAPGSNNALKEDYVRLCVGLSFNAMWFNKWKIE